ncbi:MAG TPA: hypothetical protein VGH02_04345 [Rhizomicrobium sp.]|jgi:hypothetical protein
MRILRSIVAMGIAILIANPALDAVAKATKPGKERWVVKTSLIESPAKKIVDLQDLLALRDVPGVTNNDKRYRDNRIGAFDNPDKLREGDMVTAEGWLHLIAGETDGDYHIQISASQNDGNNCLIVEIPKDDPNYVPSAALRSGFGKVRSWIKEKLFHGKEPSTGGSVLTHPVYVRVSGQLFYDDSHVGDQPRGKKGMHAATLWELHPVTAMSFAQKP